MTKKYAEYFYSSKDLAYENEVLQKPNSVSTWSNYIKDCTGLPRQRRYVIFERALKANPGNFKLWHAYLKDRKTEICGFRTNHPIFCALKNAFERSLVFLHKMPRIWLEYLDFLTRQKLVTASRRVFNRALQALPVSQHDRIWPLYLKFLRQPGIPVKTILCVSEVPLLRTRQR